MRISSGSDKEKPTAAEKSRLLEFLESAPIVTIAAGFEIDELDREKGRVVPIGLATDGDLVWPIEIQYYVDVHDVGVHVDVLESARRHGFRAPSVPATVMDDIRREVISASVGSDQDDEWESREGDANPFGAPR